MKTAIATGLLSCATGVGLYLADDDRKAPAADPQASVVDDGLPKKKVKVQAEAGARPGATTTKPTAAASEPRQRGKANDDVEGALDEPTFGDFSDTPLAQVIQFLGTQHNIRIHLDETGLANAMVDREQAVSLKMAGVRLSLLLDLLLEPLNLGYAVRENVLIISSREHIDNVHSTTVMRIGDMLPAGEEARETAERLSQLITENVDRDAWVASGGENVIQFVDDARSFVVTSNGRTQRKITKLLSDLRAAKVANGMPAKKDNPPRVAVN